MIQGVSNNIIVQKKLSELKTNQKLERRMSTKTFFYVSEDAEIPKRSK